MDDERKWHLAWAELRAFQKNLPTTIEENHVTEFHAILDRLREASGEDITPFRIPAAEVRPKEIPLMRSDYPGVGQPAPMFTDKKFCDRNLMLRRIDSVFGYFDSLAGPKEEKPKYGF